MKILHYVFLYTSSNYLDRGAILCASECKSERDTFVERKIEITKANMYTGVIQFIPKSYI